VRWNGNDLGDLSEREELEGQEMIRVIGMSGMRVWRAETEQSDRGSKEQSKNEFLGARQGP
jgi:hypothetical protein